MVQFTKLKISGFKSFVDATELVVEPGLTGVVGPNGCGKSNLVEALRWVMGETSAKRMRGDGMEDVIFAGTSNRPSRNHAEVTLHLDNRSRKAPAALNGFDELEVTRRIGRGRGSDYRVNGKLVRARDVQLLFADNATGAQSPALVSQGRVGAIINAKPTDRRSILEDAAGISGLHQRRHEAELRLRAAETNLTRLEDVLGTMETQLAGLKKQARQASRYRNLSAHIRKAEAIVLHLRYLSALADDAKARANHTQADARVRDLMAQVASATSRHEEEAERIAPLRHAEQENAATVQRLTIARDSLNSEEARLRDEQRDAEQRRDQASRDREREHKLVGEAESTLKRLQDEAAHLDGLDSGNDQAKEAVDAVCKKAETSVQAAETALGERQRLLAEAEADLKARQREAEAAGRRVADVERRLQEARRALAQADREADALGDLEQARDHLESTEASLNQSRAAVDTAEATLGESERMADAAQTRARAVDDAVATASTEAKALRPLVQQATREGGILAQVSVEAGYEEALAAAFGDELDVPADPTKPRFWQTLAIETGPTLPSGADPISRYVSAPSELASALGQIGIVDDKETIDLLAPRLGPGQALVTRDGYCLRWDGYTRTPGAVSPAALALARRNRLASLDQEIARLTPERDSAQASLASARTDLQTASTVLKNSQRQLADVTRAEASARSALARLDQQAGALATKRAGLAETVARFEAERRDAISALDIAKEITLGPNDLSALRDAVSIASGSVRNARQQHQEARTRADKLNREIHGRSRRRQALIGEQASWETRRSDAQARLEELASRVQAADNTLVSLTDRPAVIAKQRDELGSQLAIAEHARKKAADALAEAETASKANEMRLKQAESDLSDARETRARAEAAVTAARQAIAQIEDRVTERLSCTLAEIGSLSDIDPSGELPDLGQVQTRLDRLIRERETMGPVNLRADGEAQELSNQIGDLEREREDLLAAIGRLRQGIGRLNGQARSQLLTAFDVVNKHFQELFTKLFGGGHAHLKLTEADDPLDAGLEIFASPPGKKLQILSLLSGGEQALTALALLFGVFLTNPAPICVLDEVDAPLDEANVDRFCTLLDEMARTGKTRFLVVTHHRMTMARMHRLFGVTMAERGVSQLVSVDLEQAAVLRATA